MRRDDRELLEELYEQYGLVTVLQGVLRILQREMESSADEDCHQALSRTIKKIEKLSSRDEDEDEDDEDDDDEDDD